MLSLTTNPQSISKNIKTVYILMLLINIFYGIILENSILEDGKTINFKEKNRDKD
jgi:hypothetical protein